MKLFRGLLITLMLLVVLAHVSSQSVIQDSRGLVITDYENRTVILPREAMRIVPLVPSALRILVQLGAEDKIVAIDRKSTAAKASMLPFLAKPALISRPVVGDRKEPNLEAILGLTPDLIVTS